MSYAGTRPNKSHYCTHLSIETKEETMHSKQPYHVPLRTPETHKLPPKWAENEEVLCRLKEVQAPFPIKPKAPS